MKETNKVEEIFQRCKEQFLRVNPDQSFEDYVLRDGTWKNRILKRFLQKDLELSK